MRQLKAAGGGAAVRVHDSGDDERRGAGDHRALRRVVHDLDVVILRDGDRGGQDEENVDECGGEKEAEPDRVAQCTCERGDGEREAGERVGVDAKRGVRARSTVRDAPARDREVARHDEKRPEEAEATGKVPTPLPRGDRLPSHRPERHEDAPRRRAQQRDAMRGKQLRGDDRVRAQHDRHSDETRRAGGDGVQHSHLLPICRAFFFAYTVRAVSCCYTMEYARCAYEDVPFETRTRFPVDDWWDVRACRPTAKGKAAFRFDRVKGVLVLTTRSSPPARFTCADARVGCLLYAMHLGGYVEEQQQTRNPVRVKRPRAPIPPPYEPSAVLLRRVAYARSIAARRNGYWRDEATFARDVDDDEYRRQQRVCTDPFASSVLS